MTDTVQIPMGVTVEQAFNYLLYHIEQGREKDILPPREEAHGNGRVFLRAVF